MYRLAQSFGLRGWVNNGADGVHIEFNADEVLAKSFYQSVIQQAPALSCITSHSISNGGSLEYDDFRIISSSSEMAPLLHLSPDFALCEACRDELTDQHDRRYGYAFITCTQCGPRYSIMTGLPYDREFTSMAAFRMCGECEKEYHDPENRRHYSQTNSCPRCAVEMTVYDNGQNVIEEDQPAIISRICGLWKSGGIIAVKGIGGYLLTCDATNSNAVEELRKRKHRPSKPFALMFPDIPVLEREVYLSDLATATLQSAAAPIVLLQKKDNSASSLAADVIAPGLSKLGVMLPYAPLFRLLLQQFAGPIVATSGNISNASIIYEDEMALRQLCHLADFILVHNRQIIAPQDDSVITYSKHATQRIVLRRARGYAPFYSNKALVVPPTTVLATGALMKSSFTLLHQQNIHVSQYLGDTDNYDAQLSFDKVLRHLLYLFKTRPEVILVDQHPGYFTAQLGLQLAQQWSCQLVKVQHHEAHFASVLGEHNLLYDEEPVLGVVWDGTGYGTDGEIWGGEFFLFQNRTITRLTHFTYFDHLLGDKMPKEPRLSAFALCHHMEAAHSILQPKFTPAEWSNYQRLIAGNQRKTSSIGRVFDAAASLLGLIDNASYEGEAAMLLEEEAMRYFKNSLHFPEAWLEDVWENNLSTAALMNPIIQMLTAGTGKPEIAAWFHVQLALAVKRIATVHDCRKICFSGGVFQNGLLVDLLIELLGKEYQLYLNKDLSPNDENISFGQVMWFLMHER